MVTEWDSLNANKQQPLPHLEKRLDNSNQRNSGFRDVGHKEGLSEAQTENKEITLYDEMPFLI